MLLSAVPNPDYMNGPMIVTPVMLGTEGGSLGTLSKIALVAAVGFAAWQMLDLDGDTRRAQRAMLSRRRYARR
jgi:hypothetical protein